MFDTMLYKQLFADVNYHANKNSGGKIRLDAIIVRANLDGSNYTNIGFVNGPVIPYVKFKDAANEAIYLKG